MTAVGPPGPDAVLVAGCGLIGTSVGLALREAGWTVDLADIDPGSVATASALGAGRPVPWPPWAGGDSPRVTRYRIAVIAVPPQAIGPLAHRLIDSELIRTVAHVGGLQVQPQLDFEASGGKPGQLVGTHPMAGRERGGPAGASPGLFRDRPWVVCQDTAGDRSCADAEAVAAACGSRIVHMSAADHDAAVALVSHLPQLVSSALAAALTDASPAALAVAGSGLRDVTRLADGDPALWAQIIAGNATAVSEPVRALLHRFEALLAALDQGAEPTAAAVTSLVTAGGAGRRRLGGKHGGSPRHWASVQLVVPDAPGALVDVLTACRELGVNIEDLRLEHTPGRSNGLLELLVEPAAATGLAEALQPTWGVVAVVRPHD